MQTTAIHSFGRRQIVKAVTAGAAIALATTAAAAVPVFVSAAQAQPDEDDNSRKDGGDNRRGGGNAFLLSIAFNNWTQGAFPALPGPPPKNVMVVTFQINGNAGNGQIASYGGNPLFVDMMAPAQQIYDQVIEAAKQQLAQLTPAYTVQRSDVFRIVGGFTA